ncbi:MAG: hypothetical protein ACK5Q5_21450, partial [Planctomycetaceae bacterium]
MTCRTQWRVAYDAVGNLLSAADAASTYTLTYDALDRLVTVDNLGTPSLPRLVLTYGYDVASRLTSVADQTGVT